MLTAGIDLASQSRDTALCVIDWSSTPAKIVRFETNVDDDAITSVVDSVDKVGVDVPLGWPIAFVEAIFGHSTTGEWPSQYRHDDNLRHRFRRTDLWVRRELGFYPLSVATDRISLPAMRFAALSSRLAIRGPLDGSGLIVEAYPAAALFRWEFPHRRYKTKVNREIRDGLVDRLIGESCAWLQLDNVTERLCRESDDALDSLICALIARASATRPGRLVEEIPEPEREAACREGWIAVPVKGSFQALGQG